MRKFIIAIGLLLGVVFLISHFAEVEKIAITLQRGDWRFVILAVGLILLWLVNMAGSYKTIFKVLGLEESMIRLLILSASATFINVVAPSGGAGGMAVFIGDARQQGRTGARAMVAGMLFVIFDYLGFFLFLGMGLIVLFRRNIIQGAEITAAILLFLMWLGMSTLLFLGFKSEEALAKALAWLARTINKVLHPFIKRDRFNEQSARDLAHDAANGIKEIRQHPKELFYPFLLSITNKIILLLIFHVIFMAFQVPASLEILVAGTSLAYLFVIVSPTPYGIGIVEGILTLAFRSMFIPVNDALVITLAYRGITFWIPLFLGAIAFRWVGNEGEKIPIKNP
jgi:uncharacterized protein (TIRG00374 family)